MIQFLITKHEPDGVRHKVRLRYGHIGEGHGSRAIGKLAVFGLHHLLVVRSLVTQRSAYQRVTVDSRGPNRHTVAHLQLVIADVIVGSVQIRVCAVGIILQHDSDRLGVRDGVLKLHLVVVRRPVRGDGRTRLGARLQLIACPCGGQDRSRLALDGGDRVALEHLAVANQIDRDLRVLICAGILVVEGHSLVRLVLHEVGSGVAVCHSLIVVGDRYRAICEGVALADRQVLKLLLFDLSAGVHILLDDGDILRLAGIFVSHDDVANTVVLIGCEVVLHLRAIDRHALRRGGGRVVFDGRGCGATGQRDLAAVCHGAAVLAVKLLVAIFVHNHHSHIAIVLGIVESNRVFCLGVAGLDCLARRVCRVAGDRRGVDRSLYALLQRSRVALKLFSVVHRLEVTLAMLLS